MNFKDLEYFVYLVKSKSYTATAEHFYISQPSISMAIKRLEKYFDSKLIIRGNVNKKLELTDIGELVFTRANEILDTIDLIHTEVDNYQSDSVILGTPPIFGGYLLPKILPYMENYISKLKLVEGPGSVSIYEQLLDDKIPTAIVGSINKRNYSNKIIQVPLLTDQFYVVVSKNHKFANLSFVNSDSLNGENFISLGKGFAQNQVLKQWFSRHNFDSPLVQITNEIQTAKALVASDVGISLLIGMLVDSKDNIKKIKIENPPKFYINLLINKNMQINETQKRFNARLISLSRANLFE